MKRAESIANEKRSFLVSSVFALSPGSALLQKNACTKEPKNKTSISDTKRNATAVSMITKPQRLLEKPQTNEVRRKQRDRCTRNELGRKVRKQSAKGRAELYPKPRTVHSVSEYGVVIFRYCSGEEYGGTPEH